MQETSTPPLDVPIRSERDLVAVRTTLRDYARAAGLGEVDLTKLVTAGSELARNILKYAGAGGGSMRVQAVCEGPRQGVCVRFADLGPGIENLEQAMRDGYSSGGSLGLGLPGARRLSDVFSIESAPGQGTAVTVIKWRR